MGAFNIWTIVAVVAIAFGVGVVVGRVFFGKKQPPDALANMNMPLVEDRDVKGLLLSDRKIEAIKRYREQTGVGLKEAKDAVERIEAEMKTPGRYGSLNESDTVENDELRDSFGGSSHYSSSSLDDELHELVRRGRKISAIKRYREVKGVGLKEAKDVVDRMEAEMRNL